METTCGDLPPSADEQLVANIGMAPPPLGFSTRPLDADEKSQIDSLPEIPGNNTLSYSECLKLMQDMFLTHRKEIMQALFSMAEGDSTNIKKDKLFRVLNSFWIRLNKLQFDKFMNRLQENGDGTVDFKQLLVLVEGKARLNFNLAIGRKGKFSSFAPESLNVEGLEILLRTKIHANLEKIARAMRMYDEKQNGMVSRKNLKTALDHLALSMKEDQFNNLMRKYDAQQTGYVDYRNFFIKLGINALKFEKCLPTPTAEAAFSWALPSSDERQEEARRIAKKFSMDDPDLQGKSMDTIMEMFSDKLLSKMDDIRKGFLTVDVTNTGLIKPQDFRSIMNNFVYCTSEPVFREITNRLSIRKIKGMVAWEYFLDKVKEEALKPENGEKLKMHRWNRDPHTANWAKVGKGEICKCSELTSYEGPPTLPHILEQLRKFNIVPGPIIKKYFTTKTMEGELLMTRSDFKLLMGRRCCYLSEREKKDLFDILDPEHTNYVTYSRLRILFCENPPKEVCDKEDEETEDEKRIKAYALPHQKLVSLSPVSTSICAALPPQHAPGFPELSPEDAVIKLRRRIHKEWDNVVKAVNARSQARDPPWLMQEEIRQILDVLVMKLTEKQWRHLLRMLGVTTGRLPVELFLNSFKELEVEAMERWNMKIDKWLGGERQEPIPEDQLENMLFEVMKVRGKEMHRDLAKIDVESLGYIPKEKFRTIMMKYLPAMTENQFECIWSRLPVNEYCNLEYVDFLKKYNHYYNKEVPEHRCPCECQLAWDRGACKPNFGGGDVGYFQHSTEHLAASGEKNQNMDPNNTPGSSKTPTRASSRPNLDRSATSRSTSNLSRRQSHHAPPSNEIQVPFRPPTPPKPNREKYDPTLPFIPDIPKRKVAAHPRPNAGRDCFCGPCIGSHKRKPVFCNCHFQRGPRGTKSAEFVQNKQVKSAVKRPASLPTRRTPFELPDQDKALVRYEEPEIKQEVSLCDQLKEIVGKYWREIRRLCCKYDNDGFGFIDAQDFRETLKMFGLKGSQDEINELLEKFEVPENGAVNYLVFLQQFVIHLHPKAIGIFERRHLPNLPKSLQLGSPSAGLYDTLLTIRAPITGNYVSIRRKLRSTDKTGRGWIHALEFKKILKSFRVPIDDEKFFNLMEYFDPNLTGHISYNEFLRVFSLSGKL